MMIDLKLTYFYDGSGNLPHKIANNIIEFFKFRIDFFTVRSEHVTSMIRFFNIKKSQVHFRFVQPINNRVNSIIIWFMWIVTIKVCWSSIFDFWSNPEFTARVMSSLLIGYPQRFTTPKCCCFIPTAWISVIKMLNFRLKIMVQNYKITWCDVGS